MTSGSCNLPAVLLSHYQRSPLQLLGLVLIVVVAMTLWAGVSTLTGQARDSLQSSQAAIEPELHIERTDGIPVTRADFANLRRAGFCVTPRLLVTVEAQPFIELVGIDPFSASCLRKYSAQLMPEGGLADHGNLRLWGNDATLTRWRSLAPDRNDIELRSDTRLPSATLLGDIAVVARFQNLGAAKLELLGPLSLESSLPEQYKAIVTDYGVASEDLAESFLLNLDALGVLALLVAALLIRSVYVFGLSQRQQTFTVLRRAGVRPSGIAFFLGLELLLIAILGSSIGLLLGGELAQAFSNGVRATLTGLFGADTGDFSRPGPAAWLGSGLIVLAVVFWACADQLWHQRSKLGPEQNPPRILKPMLAAITVTAMGVVLILEGTALWPVYVGLALSLGGLAFCLPLLITAGLGLWQARTRSVRLEWSLSEMRALARTMTLPLIALAFAIAATIGVYTMVTSFETTFDRWLDQRLQGDLYLALAETESASGLDLARLRQWGTVLETEESVDWAHLVVRGAGLANGSGVDIAAIEPNSPLLESWRFLNNFPLPWERLRQGGGVLINEQLARRQRLEVGDYFQLRLGSQEHAVQVLAIYADYGRPAGEVLLSLDRLPPRFAASSQSFTLKMTTQNRQHWQALLEGEAMPALTASRDQQEIKQLAEDAFDRTFAITQALSGLTLVLSGVALALIGYVTFKLRQPLYTLVYVFGLSLLQVRLRLIAHAASLALLLAALAVPLGIFLSWVLVARINPLAFGWAVPFDLYPGFWLGITIASGFLGAGVGVLSGNPVRLHHLHRAVLLLPLLFALGGCNPTEAPEKSPGFSGLGAGKGQFAQPGPGMSISLPEDMGPHPEYRLEWWYLTANLESENGQRFGVQWTLFRRSLVPQPTHDEQNAWDSHEVWMAHAAVSRPGSHHFAEKFARGGVGQADVKLMPFRAWLDDWRMTEQGDGAYKVEASSGDFHYRLEFQRSGDIVRHGEDGFSAKSADGPGSMYFSFPNLEVRGRITVGDTHHQVSGSGWFDREWSSQLLRSSQKGWDWFSIHLEDGAKLMVFQLRGEEPFYSGTFVSPDGTVHTLGTEKINLVPNQSRATPQGKIPVGWRLKITDFNLDLRINSWPANYWNPGAFPYWEGPVEVSGSHTGKGFLEMTGYGG